MVSASSPGLDTTASPGGGVGSTLTDSATLSGGYFPTGIVTFTLTDPGGSVVDTEITSVDGNATYTITNGFTLFRRSAAKHISGLRPTPAMRTTMMRFRAWSPCRWVA